jgi:hypothetical protein
VLGERLGLGGLKRSLSALARQAGVIAQIFGIAAQKLIGEGWRVE